MQQPNERALPNAHPQLLHLGSLGQRRPVWGCWGLYPGANWCELLRGPESWGVGVAGAPGWVLEWRSPSPSLEPRIRCCTTGEVPTAERPKASGVSSQEIPSGSRSSPTHCTRFRQGLPERCTGADIFIPQAEAAEELPHHPELGPPGRLLSPDRSPAGQALGAMARAGGTYSVPRLLRGVYSLRRYQGRSHLSTPSGNTSAHVKPSLSFFLFKAM